MSWGVLVMKVSAMVAVATGVVVAVAFGGVAMAAELETAASTEIEAVVETIVSDESSDSDDDGVEETPESGDTGLVCILVPFASEEPPLTGDGEAVEAEVVESPTIDDVLAGGTIECSGTGNERSSEVATLPRFLAHSDEWSGAEKGAAISEWAKTHANQKSDDEDADEPIEGDADESTDDSADGAGSNGRSDDAPGRSGSHPGNGNGNGNGNRH